MARPRARDRDVGAAVPLGRARDRSRARGGGGVLAFSPAQVSGTKGLWVPYLGNTNNGTHYSLITDLSGNGAHLDTAGGSGGPARTTNLKNGKEGLTSVAASGRSLRTSASVSLTGSLAIVVVFRASTVNFIYHHNGGVTYLYASITNTSNINRAANQSGKNRASNWASDNAWRVVSIRCDGTHAGHTMRINAADQSLTNGSGGNDPGTGTASAGAVAFLCTSDGATQTTGDFLGGWFCSPDPGAAAVAQVESWFNTAFAVY